MTYTDLQDKFQKSNIKQGCPRSEQKNKPLPVELKLAWGQASHVKGASCNWIVSIPAQTTAPCNGL